MRFESISILSGSSVAGINGAAKDVNQVVNLTVQTLSSGAGVAGVLKLQASNDACNTQSRATFVPTNWVDIPSASATITAGVPALIVISNIAIGFIRAVWTPDGGGSTGTVSALMSTSGA